MVTYYDCIRVNFMYVGMAWVRPWRIAPEGEYIKLALISWYGCYYIRDNFMYVGVAWVHP